MSPQRPNFVLTADVPNGETDIFVFNGFNIETNGWNGGDNFAQLQFVQDGSFSSGVKTNCKMSKYSRLFVKI